MRNYYLLVNPVSGHKRGLSVLDKVKSQFEAEKISVTIHVTKDQYHTRQLAETLAFEKFDGCCIIGGDGTVHEFINGMKNRKNEETLPIGLIPSGTGNSLARHLGCLDTQIAIERILLGKLIKLDLFQVNEKHHVYYGFNVLGWGIPSDINVLAEKLRWARSQRYNLASLIEIIKNRIRPAKILIGQNLIEGNFGFIVACNTKYTGKGMQMAPLAQIDDGLIDLLIVKRVGRLKLLSLFSKIFKGNHIYDPVVAYHQIKEFSILEPKNELLAIDGQIIGKTPIHVKVQQGAIEIFA